VLLQLYNWVSNNGKLNANGWSVPLNHTTTQISFFYNVIMEIIYSRLTFYNEIQLFCIWKEFARHQTCWSHTPFVCFDSLWDDDPALSMCVCVKQLQPITTNPYPGNRWAMAGSLGLTYLIIFTVQTLCIGRTLKWWDD